MKTTYNCARIVLHNVPKLFRHMEPPVFGPYFNHTDEAYILHTKASYRLANLLVSRDTYPSSNSTILRREHGDLESHLHLPYVFGTYKGTHRRYACLSTPLEAAALLPKHLDTRVTSHPNRRLI